MAAIKPYIGSPGLAELSLKLRGDENVFLGIRPFGFHAGNMLSILAYPLTLCATMKKKGKTPRFAFHVFLNDYEQHKIVGHESAPDQDDEVNIYPADTTLQYALSADGKTSVTDYWAPVIESNLSLLREANPETSIRFIRSSSLRDQSVFKETVYKSIRYAKEIADIVEEEAKMRVRRPADYCRPVCPECHTPNKNFKTTLRHEFSIACDECGHRGVHKYEALDFWLNHKPLALPRISLFNIDLCITGIDHLYSGDFTIRTKLFDLMKIPHRPFDTLYAPLLLREDGSKMSKSAGNQGYLALPDLLALLQQEHKETILVPDRILKNKIQPKTSPCLPR